MFSIETSFMYALFWGFIVSLLYLIWFISDQKNDKEDMPIFNISLLFFFVSAFVYIMSENDEIMLIPNIKKSETLCKMKTGKQPF
ncbi:hypothetical protein JO84_gp186 [Aureococcus anophagefferens virus]|uniref:Uncharacterized protein n=1 Tax=Aureococcus anophagefferens virus TaxID=1474867 RepID=A0A076FGN5_9VIRU|nr:hypothetical protein JO84_gp186 [Aureococcus anophagefferens virus]AII17250.1 hypothetical protein AaV_289 [Aureococcus anophagefferens virus]UOG94203.1 hypothetical protein MKD35_162 [Aureococcus anophagefferens virus]